MKSTYAKITRNTYFLTSTLKFRINILAPQGGLILVDLGLQQYPFIREAGSQRYVLCFYSTLERGAVHAIDSPVSNGYPLWDCTLLLGRAGLGWGNIGEGKIWGAIRHETTRHGDATKCTLPQIYIAGCSIAMAMMIKNKISTVIGMAGSFIFRLPNRNGICDFICAFFEESFCTSAVAPYLVDC